MMDIYQTLKLWASLSPNLVKPSSDHLPSNDEDYAHQEQSDQAQSDDSEGDHSGT